MARKRLGTNQQKVLLLLRAGVALSLMKATGVKRQTRVLHDIADEWRMLNRIALERSIESLYRSKLVKRKVHQDGTVTLVLTEAGIERALRYDLAKLSIAKPKRWDGKWRLVMYDIPEDERDLRLELLRRLKHLGFVELQHSVFIHPYECKDEIEYLIEVYDARTYIRRLVVEEIDTPEPLLKHFNLRTHRA